MLLVKKIFLIFFLRKKACFAGKNITFCYELTLFEFKIATATAQQKGMDWAGFEPATSRLRSEHYYP
jgi:hypothetical protein